ncbi:MAG TPA: hypothetical protein VMW27_19500 [Thermoanaerobaculia bacterium]|nr:hypothetical protein [Thermoanaerobaculia bacterium]
MGLTMLDLNGLERGGGLTYSPEPLSRLPRIWIGFVLAFGFLVAEIVELSQGNADALGPYTVTAAILGWAYWFFCIHRFHKILGQMTAQAYPITPRQAVGYHFIPVVGLFWFFKWARELSNFLSERTAVKMASGTGLGAILFVSTLAARLVDGFIGLSLLFGAALYISRKLRQVVAAHEKLRDSAEAFA